MQKRSRRKRQDDNGDMVFQSFMSLMVVLIPVLLISIEFAKISVIDLQLPVTRGSNPDTRETTSPRENKHNKLVLTAVVTDTALTLLTRVAPPASIYYKEYRPGPGERGRDIELHMLDSTGGVIECSYSPWGEMVTDTRGQPLNRLAMGDTVLLVSTDRRPRVVRDPAAYDLRPLSAYDELRNRLLQIKEEYPEADDADRIIIAAENEVVYDKLVQVMDAAGIARFRKISICKLRSS